MPQTHLPPDCFKVPWRATKAGPSSHQPPLLPAFLRVFVTEGLSQIPQMVLISHSTMAYSLCLNSLTKPELNWYLKCPLCHYHTLSLFQMPSELPCSNLSSFLLLPLTQTSPQYKHTRSRLALTPNECTMVTGLLG